MRVIKNRSKRSYCKSKKNKSKSKDLNKLQNKRRIGSSKAQTAILKIVKLSSKRYGMISKLTAPFLNVILSLAEPIK